MNADEKREFYKGLRERIKQLRMEHLFEEPCPLYEDEMRKINTFTLNITVAILDFLYQGRHFQRFWVLEEIARAPYFAFLSVLHLRESLGLRGQWHTYLMKQHFEQSVNETEHLEIMESRGGNADWIDRFLARHLVLVYYWINVVYYWVSPRAAYHLSYEIEIHAMETYEVSVRG